MEHKNVVADQISVAFVGVKLHSNAANVTRGALRATLALRCRKPLEHQRDLAGFLEWRRFGVLG